MKIHIGLDAGINTGFAVFDVASRLFTELHTYEFWEAIYRLQDYHRQFKEQKIDLVVVVEDVVANKPTFKRELPDDIRDIEAYKDKISQGVGENKAHCKLLVKWCEDRGIPIRKIRPTKASFTKLDPGQFTALTQYSGRTSSHARDAAMLVYYL